MSYVAMPSLVETALVKHNATVECSGSPYSYANCTFLDGIVPELDLLSSQLDLYKNRIEAKIRAEAAEKRLEHTEFWLSTRDNEQIRTYEEKYEESSDYLVNNMANTPITTAEASHTGEVVSDLAELVVAQHTYIKAQLKVAYGHIEGIRREHLSIIDGFTTLLECETYSGPDWTWS